MFMSVDVRNGDSRRLNLANLCGGFGGNLIGVDAPGDRARGESHQAIAEGRGAGQRGELLRAQNWPAIDEHDMATDAEFRDRLCQLRGLVESQTISHERRRSYDAARVSLHNGPVHARCEAKIICVDDQTPHPASLAGQGIQILSALLAWKLTRCVLKRAYRTCVDRFFGARV